MTQQDLTIDLSNCEKEPIHIPGKIQGHGLLIICDVQNLKILDVSLNTQEKMGFDAKELINQPLDNYIDRGITNLIVNTLRTEDDLQKITPIKIQFDNNADSRYYLIPHLHDNRILLEFEPMGANTLAEGEFYFQLEKAVDVVRQAADLEGLYVATANQIKALTGYDRAMVYRFDEDWNGEVIAEAKAEHLESFLGLHYPATDIPAQARALFAKNWLRMIADVDATDVMLLSAESGSSGQIDLTYSILRSTSPMHIQYLKNMDVGASLTISIILKGKLWGLIACHHYHSHFVDYSTRRACLFLGRMFSGYLSLLEEREENNALQDFSKVQSDLFNQMTENWDIAEGLTERSTNLLDLNSSSGAAIVTNDSIRLVGSTPDEGMVRELVEWLKNDAEIDEIYQTDRLPLLYTPAQQYKDKASGLIAISISPQGDEYLLWFKPEVIQTVDWGGNPEKPVEPAGDGLQINPRKSFEKWSQQIENRSLSWPKHEITLAKELRNNIIQIIREKHNEVQSLTSTIEKVNNELDSFSYSVSHDLRAPLRSIDGFASILLDDYGQALDKEGTSLLKDITDSVGKMEQLIDDLLVYSRVSVIEKFYNVFDLRPLVEEVYRDLRKAEKDKQLDFEILDLPKVYGDRTLLRQLLVNLISNAIKYTGKVNKPMIQVGSLPESKNQHIIYVKDNGIGFSNDHASKLFGVFVRLVKDKDFEGTGVGLAISRQVVERHHGKIWAEGIKGQGATFFFSLPTLGK
ncbi:MAG: ATP-binding protein [Bacteroidota bacterium]